MGLGADATCVWRQGEQARCWGGNAFGELGDGSSNDGPNPDPRPVRLGDGTALTGVTQLAVGSAFACAVLADSTVRCWGSNYYGELGGGAASLEPSLVPVAVTADGGAALRGAKRLAPGMTHACALLDDATARCWGSNEVGELGNGKTSAREDPHPVPSPVLQSVTAGDLPLADVRDLALGYGHACAVLAGGAVKCWGDNESGQLGNGPGPGSPNARPVYVYVDGMTRLERVERLALGLSHSCALGAGGAVLCWGANADGELGRGFADGAGGPPAAPVRTAGGAALGGARELAAGGSHSCARPGDGAL